MIEPAWQKRQQQEALLYACQAHCPVGERL